MIEANAPLAHGGEMARQVTQFKVYKDTLRLVKARVAQEQVLTQREITMQDWIDSVLREAVKKPAKKGSKG